MTQDPSVRAFLLTNISLPTSSNPHVHFRIPVSNIGDAITEIGGFPYEPNERAWNGRVLFIKGSKSRSVCSCCQGKQLVKIRLLTSHLVLWHRYINHHNISLAKEYFPNMILKELDTGHWGKLYFLSSSLQFHSLIVDELCLSELFIVLQREVHAEKYVEELMYISRIYLMSMNLQSRPNQFRELVTEFIHFSYAKKLVKGRRRSIFVYPRLLTVLCFLEGR